MSRTSPRGGDATDRNDATDHPDTTARGLRRRAFVVGAGSAAAGLVGVGGAGASFSGRDEDDWYGGDDWNRGSDHGKWRGGPDDEPSTIAHRGFAGLYPENTVGAVEHAAGGGRWSHGSTDAADAIEIDVVPTADGTVVAFHDDRLSSRDGGERGLTDASGVVWETDTETVTSAEVLQSGETVPTFEAIMAAIPPHVTVNVELKNPGSSEVRFAENLSGDALAAQKDLWRPFVERVLDVVDRHRNEILFSSFYEGAIATAREASEYAVAPLLWDSIEDGLAVAREYDAEAIHPPYNMVQGTPFFRDDYYTEGSEWSDVDLVATAHEEGRDVNVYTLATWYQAERLAAAGVDGLIADYPGLLRFGARE